MPDQIRVSVSKNAAAILRKLEAMADWMLKAVAKAMDRQNQLTVGQIQQRYLSFPKDGPVVPIGCRVITNRLRQSIRASDAVVTGNAVNSSIGSNVVYAAVQEFGIDQNVSVSPHMRKDIREQDVFGKRRMVRRADIGVRAHTRHMKMEGRHFVRNGIADRLPSYSAAISRAIISSWNEHQPSNN